MTSLKIFTVSAVLAFAAPVFASEVLTFSPGQWEGQVSATLSGQDMSNETLNDCMPEGKNTVSAADLEEMMGGEFACQYTNVETTSTTITADVMCDAVGMNATYEGKSVVTHSDTQFSLTLTGELKAEMGQAMPAGMSVTARQISPVCN